jgi:hypothetical protein
VGGTLLVPDVEMSISKKSFMVRSTVMWNSIPLSLRAMQNLETFKKNLKIWTRQNVELE